jgi:hypothetical protein
MKICILSIGRSGSTSLYNAIIRHLHKGYYCIGEPFNDKIDRIIKIDENQFDLISKKENVLIKTILTHKPNEMDNDTFNNWLFTFFDKIILLDRLDKKSQVESFSFLVHTKNKEWHKKQFYNMSLVPKDFIDEWDDRLSMLKNKLGELSLKHNKKIYFYEDIFVNKNMDTINEIFNYLEIKMDENIINEFIISEDRKVRLNEKKNRLI